MRHALIVSIILLAGLAAATAAPPQTPPPAPPAKTDTAPVLSEVDRLKLVNALQAIDVASLRVQVAAGELARVRGDADKLITALQIPGWVLNDKLEYVRPEKGGGGH